jgi:urease accessory protein
MLRRVLMFAMFAAIVLLPTAASAHTGAGALGGFASGFLHPVLGLDHLLAMLAVGMWGARIGGRSVWMLPAAFILVMAVGGFLGAMGVPFPFVEAVIAISVFGLGLALALAARPAGWVLFSIVAVFAVFHGHAHGTELPGYASAATYGVGFVAATGLIHLTGVVLGLSAGSLARDRVARASGTAISLAGICFLLA